MSGTRLRGRGGSGSASPNAGVADERRGFGRSLQLPLSLPRGDLSLALPSRVVPSEASIRATALLRRLLLIPSPRSWIASSSNRPLPSGRLNAAPLAGYCGKSRLECLTNRLTNQKSY